MKTHDDFIWENYSLRYGSEIQTEFLHKGIDMIVSEVELDDKNELIFTDNLHPNWKELYHLIHKLKVKSIFECGCGCAHHLINSQKINPNLLVNGCDYSDSQIKLGVSYFGLEKYEFSKRLKVRDMTNIPDIESLGKHEFVYTQAVAMHLSDERVRKFLHNMSLLSSKYIFMIENVSAHDWNSLIKEFFPEFERVIDNKYIDYGILLKKR
jgi:hypothetical protein